MDRRAQAPTADQSIRPRRRTRYAPPFTSEEQADYEAFRRDLGGYVDDLNELIPRFGTNLGWDPGGHGLAALVRTWVEEATPRSLVRIGEGEGALLAATLGEHPALTSQCLRRVSDRHLGDPEAIDDRFIEAMGDAILGADAVGLLNLLVTMVILNLKTPNPDERESASGATAQVIFTVAQSYRWLNRNLGGTTARSKTLVDAAVNTQLEPVIRELVRGRRIGLITCHPELPDAVVDRLGATDVDFLQVPYQALLTPDGTHTRHYPDRFEEILSALETIPPGQIWLAGAGMAAKVYCTAVKRGGGIGIDVGSMLDQWAGVVRPGFLQDLTSMRIVE